MRCAADRKSTKNCIRLVFFCLLYNDRLNVSRIVDCVNQSSISGWARGHMSATDGWSYRSRLASAG